VIFITGKGVLTSAARLVDASFNGAGDLHHRKVNRMGQKLSNILWLQRSR
jgi:hypothetical protein